MICEVHTHLRKENNFLLAAAASFQLDPTLDPFFLHVSRDNDVVNDPAVKQVVVEQTRQWSDMIERHRKENWELMRTHLQAQEDVLKKLMQAQQQMQIKELENIFEK